MDYANFSLQGDYLEFGVFEGKSMALAYQLACRRDNLQGMRFYAFDSFEGLPESQGVDREGYRHSGMGPGAFSCSEPQFRRNLEGWGVDLSRVEIVPGWYESTVPVLEFIRPLLQNGTLILFDDWFCFHGDPKRGERRAFGEWLRRNPDLEADEFRRFGPYGNSFILRLRGGAQPQM